jgi:hypothetical protein
MTIYEFWYCDTHDCRWITSDKISHCSCDKSQLDYKGSIDYDGIAVEEVDSVEVDYNFREYSYNILQSSNLIKLDDSSPFMIWFDKKYHDYQIIARENCEGCREGYENQLGHSCMGY